MLDSRKTQIIWYLLSLKNYTTLKRLSDLFNVSKRTIQYDLDAVDDWLNSNCISQLKKVPRRGILLDLPNEQIVLLKQRLSKQLKNYTLSPLERQQVILFHLLKYKKVTAVKRLATLADVSSTTIYNDLASIEKWLYNYDLTLFKKKGYGVKVKGDEENLSLAFSQLITSLSSDHYAKELESDIDRHIAQMSQQFPGLDLLFIKKKLKKAEEILSIKFSYEAYISLISHIALALKRVQLNKDIYMPSDQLQELKKTQEFAVAASLAEKLEQHFSIKFPIDEVGFITFHLLGTSHANRKNKYKQKDKDVKMKQLVEEIIAFVEGRLGLTFSMSPSLRDNLYNHLVPTIARLKDASSLNNPLLTEIKNKYSDIFLACGEALIAVEKKYKVNFTEHEVAYMTMHFLAAMEQTDTHSLKSSQCDQLIAIISKHCSVLDKAALKVDVNRFLKTFYKEQKR
ncbi:transcription antiterminator [Proteinivorax hydrogeniformans]|uniref:Transcription antiterminator n=1 Tax=Proteinivorax hydrogeniformans TaxID=1826727 RepID=A0AAU8HSL5_9FIRM